MSTNLTEIDLKALLTHYLKYWKWFLLCSIFFLCLAFIYLRYSIPEYNATARIQILEDKGASSELSVLEDLNVFSGGKTQIKDEIEILRARSNFIELVKELKLNIRYFILGNVKDNELYDEEGYPFSINFLAADSIVNKSQIEFYVDLESETSFLYSEEENGPFKKYAFGSNINTAIGDIVLVPYLEQLPSFTNKRLRIVVNPIPLVAQSYRSKIKLSPADELSNIVNISLTDPIKKRAIDIINKLIATYNENAVEDKKNVADKTSKFIDDRISEIYNSLSSVDETAETFKESRGIADLGSQSNVNFSQSAASENQLQETSIQLNIANSMKDLISEKSHDYIPTNVGLNDQGIASSAQQYNELVAQRNRLLKSSNEKNPVIVKLDQQLDGLRRGMQSSLNNVTNNLNLQVNSLSKQLSQINSRIYAAPSNERALRDISRRQQTTESLYLYLLQKREESQITFASASPKSKIIDSAFSESPYPVSPKPKIIYLAALMIGLLIPFSVIYVNDILDSKLHNKLDLEKIVGNVPVLAEIPMIGKKAIKLIQKEDRSVLAESMRILRTNLDYILKSKSKSMDKAQVVFVTSSIPGEGKTFVSSNLATIFANTGKKVLLIGADIRNPKLYTFFSETRDINGSGVKPKRNEGRGLTEYLFDNSLSENEIIVNTKTNTNDIDVIYSGKIPPNPSELLMGDRMGELFEKVSQTYDYIIVDTAPLMVVTDTLLISQYANQVLYVTKANVTEKKVMEYPLKLKKEGKLKNLAFVVNGVKQSNLGYGGKYGYGYGKTVKKWWSFS